MPLYESLVIFGGGLGKREMVKLLKSISRPIVEEMGVIRSIDNVGLKPLPEAMRGANGLSHRYGHFIRFRYDCNPMRKSKFEKEMNQHHSILRYHSRKIKNRDILYEYLYFNRDCSLNYLGSRDHESFETLEKLGRVPGEEELEEIRKRVEALGINLHDEESGSESEQDEDYSDLDISDDEDDDEEEEDEEDGAKVIKDDVEIEDLSYRK